MKKSKDGSRRESLAQYKREERKRHKENGYIRFELWIKPEWKQAIVEFVEKLKGEK